MKQLFLSSVVVAILATMFAGCEKIQSYPPVPKIVYKSFWLRDTSYLDTVNKGKAITLSFEFIDGDGDFGLFRPDSGETDTTKLFNLYLTSYQKINNQFVPDTSLLSELSFPIYYFDAMSREGQNKTMEGSISIVLELFDKLIKYDTIKYDFYIVDRALNKSNVETTPEIVLK